MLNDLQMEHVMLQWVERFGYDEKLLESFSSEIPGGVSDLEFSLPRLPSRFQQALDVEAHHLFHSRFPIQDKPGNNEKLARNPAGRGSKPKRLEACVVPLFGASEQLEVNSSIR